jgi:RNA 2',3'-cyclic 3'-phosphodiesterase
MSRGATARLFVAVDPPTSVREELVEWARGVAAGARMAGSSRGWLRLLDADSLHLTLCFLGSRPVGEIEALARALAARAEPSVELSIGAPLWLPTRRPSALAVEVVDRTGELARLQERVGGALADASAWGPERRRFRPHITLARVRGGGRSRSSTRPVREQPLPATPQLSFTAEAIVLYRSWLTSEGATYEALAEYALAAAER